MKAVLAVDQNWGIGYKGDLLFKIPEDMKFFKEKTIGKIIIMGRGTFDSLPGKRPLKDRVNIVLSRNISFEEDGVIICNSKEKLFQEIKKFNKEDIYVIGGEEICRLLLPFCSEAYITKIESKFEADRHMENLDDNEQWYLQEESSKREFKGVNYRFLKYVNKGLVNKDK